MQLLYYHHIKGLKQSVYDRCEDEGQLSMNYGE